MFFFIKFIEFIILYKDIVEQNTHKYLLIVILINLKKNKLQNKNVDENSIKAIYFLVTLRNMDDVFSAFLVKNSQNKFQKNIF